MGSAVGSTLGGIAGSALGGPVGGAIGSSLGGALFGGGGGGGGGQGMSQEALAEARRRADQATFKPYTVTTSAGQTSYTPDQGFRTQLAQPYQDIMGTSLAGAGRMFDRAATFDPTARGQQVFQEQAALLQPEFERQATALQSRLFGSGRLGLRLAGEGAGLGAGSGMVQPDALGLGRAQQQTLAEIAAGSREQAMREQAQLQELATGMLGAGMSVSDMERALMAQGVDAETARAAAAYGAGNLAVSPYSDAVRAQSEAQANRMSLFGGLGSSLIGAAGDSGLFSGGGSSGGLFGRSSAPIETASGFKSIGPAAGSGSSGVFF